MIGYITLGSNDLQRAGQFYDALLSEIGLRRLMTDTRMLAWGTQPGQTLLSVIEPFDEQRASVGNGVMVALDVGSAEQVQASYQRALSLGAVDEGEPRDRGSDMGFYGGYFRDLDGNKLVVYCLGWSPPNGGNE